jgi:hypothetical protein
VPVCYTAAHPPGSNNTNIIIRRFFVIIITKKVGKRIIALYLHLLLRGAARRVRRVRREQGRTGVRREPGRT